MNAMVTNRNEAMRRARLVSNVFHPWVILAIVVALAAYQASGGPIEWIKWALLAYLPCILFPLLYAKIRASILSRQGNQQKISRSLVRDKPGQLFIMTVLVGAPASLILYYLDGPRNLLIIIIGVTAIMLVLALVNLTYRASFHLSMVTGMLTALWFLFGAASLISYLLIPILGYSRRQLGEHTIGQMVAGFLIGLVVSGTIFSGLGLGA